MSKHVEIFFGPSDNLSNGSFSKPVFMGDAWFERIRNSEITSFEYAESWLKAETDIFIDPDILPFAGRQYTPFGKPIFGSFGDSCPDRWGRMLPQRKETRTAALEQRTPLLLNESDYLLGVNDQARMGAFRFLLAGDTEFSASPSSASIPPWTSLRSLEHAAAFIEKNELSPQEIDEDLSILLEPGSSLGGARPKASVIDPEGDLWIAKFSSKNDTIDVGLAEYLLHQLAIDFDIEVPEAKVEKFGTRGAHFFNKTFRS